MQKVQQQASLVTDQKVQFFWPGTAYVNQKGCKPSSVLYEGRENRFILSQPSCTDEETLSLLSAVEEGLKSSTNNSELELRMKMCIDETIVKTLSNLMTEPKVIVRGQFHYSTHLFSTPEWLDIKMSTVREPCAVLALLHSEKYFTDCCIITAEDTEVTCHRGVLAANSDVIRAMLTNDMQESQTNRIEMKDINEEVVNQLLSYIYGRAINTKDMKEEIAFDLLRTAHKYNITSLEELITVTLFNRPNDSFNMNTVLHLYFFTMNVDELNLLYEKMLNILKSNPKRLLASSTFQDLLKKSPEEASKLALKLLELVIGEPSIRALPSI
ncbi:Speckle-type POZ protein B [Orchesella cincta]|uniref:Speckle-type POZ protein B n=1 Tax=Orchesella cincta TaxID=48709 RepID=A0A1D2MC33_ORCCI|nr:Speckle-type POZ protein B [Orchesella cincta]